MRIKYRLLMILTIIYIYLPTAIFITGWTRTWIALLTLLIIGAGLVFMVSDMCRGGDDKDVFISYPVFVVCIWLIILICIQVGFGGFYPQAGDWYKHNAVLRDLTIEKWPVYYKIYDESMLTYYLGQYMVPAFIGKIFGSFSVSNIMMAVWGISGVILTYLHLVRICKADNGIKQLTVLAFMFFFCGALLITQDVLSGVYGSEMNSLGSYHWILIRDVMVQYRSNLVMLRWVFPQTIVPWLVTIMLAENTDKVKYYVLMILPVIIFGTFSFAALAFSAIVLGIIQLLNRNIRIDHIFSVFNVLPAISMGTVFFFYFLGFIQVEKPFSSAFRFQTYPGMYIFIYIIFCFFMFGIYSMLVWKDNKNNPLYYINVVILLVLPWCHMGLCNDIVMSASIPSLFYLMIMTLQVLFKDDESTVLGIKKGIIICVFLIGCWYPARELKDNIVCNSPGLNLGDGYVSLKWFSDRSATDISEDLKYNYYTYDLDDKIFYNYIARK